MKKQASWLTLYVTTALCSFSPLVWGMEEDNKGYLSLTPNKEKQELQDDKEDQEKNRKKSSHKLTGRSLTIQLLGEETRFYEEEVPYDGDCGYTALGTNRQAATELLLQNTHREDIRKLIAPEIYDMLSQLPKKHPIKQFQAYQLNLGQQKNLARQYQIICTTLNDYFQRPEKNRWNGDQLWHHCQQNLNTIQNNFLQNQSYETFQSLREQIKQNEEERMQFCCQRETVESYIKNFMQIPVNAYYTQYGDNNWLNYSPLVMQTQKYRPYAINAIAQLLGKNLLIVDEEGNIKHQYQFSETLIGKDSTLFLRHIGNYHFNRLLFLERNKDEEYLSSLRPEPILKKEVQESRSKSQNSSASLSSLFKEHMPFLPSSKQREALKSTILKATEAGALEQVSTRLLPPPEGFVRLRGEVFGEESYLIPHAVALEILSRNAEGHLMAKAKEEKNETQDEQGNHPVKAREGIHFKANDSRVPLSPGMEGALYLFQELFAGKGMSPSTLLTLEGVSLVDEKTNQRISATVPLQASLTVTGKRFKGHLQEIIQGKAALDSLDSSSFSALMLGSLLTNPTDAKPGNFMLRSGSSEGKFEIVGIDNDMALVYPINLAQKGNSFCHYIEIKNSLYCLTPLMKTRVNEDPALRQRILSHHGETFVLRWLAHLRAQNQSYEKLSLSSEEKERLGLPLKLVPGFGKRLLGEVKKLQAILRDYPQATHDEVLERMHPLVHAYYHTVLSYHDRMKQDLEENGSLIKKNPTAYFQQNKDTFFPYITTLEDFKRAIENPQEELSFYRAYQRIHIGREAQPLESLLEMKKKVKQGKREVPLYRFLRQETTAVDIGGGDRQETIIEAAQQLLSEIDFEHLPLTQQREILALIGESFPDLAVPQSWKQKDILLPLLQDAEPEALKAILPLLKTWGLDLNTLLTETQGTPLHKLILSETNPEQLKKKVEIYLAQGINLEVMDAQKNTPLDLACQKNTSDLVVQLIKGGAGQNFQRRALIDFYHAILQKGELSQHLIQALETLEQRNPKAKWTLTYERILPSIEKDALPVQSMLYRKRSLSKALVSQLWNQKDNNKFIKVNTYGRKEVGRIQVDEHHSLYFKRLPELAGLGYAASQFLLSLCGHGGPFMDIARIGREFFLVSQGIEGETLQDVLTRSPDTLKHLDPKRTAEFILMTLLLCPEDGKPDNYILQPLGNGQYQLVGVDDEHAFASPMVKVQEENKVKIYPHVKSVIFCLDQMRDPLLSEVRQAFLNLNPASFLRQWLRHITDVHSDFIQMFKPQEAIDFLLKEKVAVGIFFTEKMVSRLYERINRLQHILAEERDNTLPSLTPLEILQRLDSDLGKRYVFQEKLSVKDRFDKIEGQFYQKGKGGAYLTSTSAAAYLKSHDIPFQTNTIEALKRGSLGPAQAELELEAMIKEQSQLDLQVSGLDTFKTLRTNKAKYQFLKKLNAQKIPLPTQRAFLESLKESPCPHLFFTQWKALETNHLTQLLFFTHLISLEAPGCTEITEDIFGVLAEQCPLLEHLNLSKNPQFKRILGYDKIKQQGIFKIFEKMGYKEWIEYPLFFKYLKHLQLNECSNLEEVKLETPNLSIFEANRSVKLFSLELAAPRLRRAEFKQMSHLTDEKLAAWVNQWPQIDTLSLEGCEGTKLGKFWETWPPFGREILKLRELKLYDSDIWDEEAAVIAQMPSLTALDLTKNHITDNGVKILCQNVKLTKLALGWNDIGYEGVKTLAGNPVLTELYLTGKSDEEAKAFENNTTLVTLSIFSSGIGDEGAKALSKIPTLTSLRLYMNNISDEGAKALAQSTSLTDLDIGDNLIYKEESMTSINHMLNRNKNRNLNDALNNKLKSLNLRNKGIAEGTKKAISDLKQQLQTLAKNTTLTKLDLSSNQLGDEEAKILAQNSTLRELNLADNNISDEGIKALKTNMTLTSLNLSHNKISDEGAKVLKQNTVLTELCTKDIKMDEKLLKAIKIYLAHYNWRKHIPYPSHTETSQKRDSSIPSPLSSLAPLEKSSLSSSLPSFPLFPATGMSFEEKPSWSLYFSQKTSPRVGFGFGVGISPWQTASFLHHMSISLNQPVYRLADVIFATGESVAPVLACVASEEGQAPYWEPQKVVTLFGSPTKNTSHFLIHSFEHLLFSDCLTNVYLPYMQIEPKPQKKSLLKSFAAQKDIASDFYLKDIVSLYEKEVPLSIKPASLSQLTHPFLKNQFDKIRYTLQGDFHADVSLLAFTKLKKQTQPSSIQLLAIENQKQEVVAEEIASHQYLSLSPERIGNEEAIKSIIEEGSIAFFRKLGELASQKHPYDLGDL